MNVYDFIKMNVYEFVPSSKLLVKKFSLNIPVPKTSYSIGRLSPGSVYNVTIQAGTTYGYGILGWAVFSTLDRMEDGFVLRQRMKTPNAFTLSWPSRWLPTPTSKYTIRAKTLHSPDNVEKEVMNMGVGEAGKTPEFILRNLHPGSTYNVSITTAIEAVKPRTMKWDDASRFKTAWSVFSTLTQGEYVVSEPRIVVETDTAASIVFQPLKHLGDVQYQVRAKVDGHWNKWTPIARRPWNLLERACSVNPPQYFVDQIGNREYMREVDLSSANAPLSPSVWRYLVVVDSRQSDFSSIDITKLADKAASDYDNTPYYITASLSPEQVHQNVDFRLGDGVVHGGYLNYPLKESQTDPRWTLVPMSQNKDGSKTGSLVVATIDSHVNLDAEYLAAYFLELVDIDARKVFWIQGVDRKSTGSGENPNQTKESSIMYYHNDTPNTQSTTREYRKVERREFRPADMEARMRFLEE
ncbi:unnamed protein product [Nippostrongylus brasiliensis]|uniref:Fibronectin type-III domain-containing protein n=1 Tax=Nippostrongylus brasiliensis TaxID=27835 RepID=A0A0N4YAU8_NIPBR|nr:unnamed protein product [Nippostrongylus brasiliensis]